MLRSIGKQSGESVESVLKKKRKATVGRICRNGRFLPGMKNVVWVPCHQNILSLSSVE